MSKQTLIDLTLLTGDSSDALDVSGSANQFEISTNVTEIDTTSFADLVRKRIAGLQESTFSLQAFKDDSAADPWEEVRRYFAGDVIFGAIESNASMAEGDYGAFGKFLASSHSIPAGGPGDPFLFTLGGSGSDAAAVGRVLQQDESLTVTGTSTGIQFGAVASGQKLWAAQWVLSGSGTLDTIIQSDDNSGFTSATNRITFTQASGAEAQFSSVAGAITDDWWRVSYTIATGPFTAVVMIGLY